MGEYSDITQLGIGTTQLMRGWQQIEYIPQPAAGVATVTRIVPGQTWERVIMARSSFTTSAAVLNRFAFWQLSDGDGNVIITVNASGTVVASSAAQSMAAPGILQSLTASGGQRSALWDIVMPSGWSFSYSISPFDVADQIGKTTLIIQRFPSDIASGDDYYVLLDRWRQEYHRVMNSGNAAQSEG